MPSYPAEQRGTNGIRANQLLAVTLTFFNQGQGPNYPHHIGMFQPIFETFRLAWPSPMANGKLSLGDVEATVAGTFDVDQSALANKVLHYVNVTRYSETRTYYILALFYQLWWFKIGSQPSKVNFLVLLLGICAWHNSFTLQTYKNSVDVHVVRKYSVKKNWNIYLQT